MLAKELYLSWLLDSTPAVAKRVLDNDALVSSLEEDFHLVVTRRTDHGWCSQYREHCHVPKASVDDYRLREVRLRNGVGLLSGVHFYGGDVTKPFVGVYAQSRDLTFDEMREATIVLCNEFSMFDVHLSWWWIPTGQSCGPDGDSVNAFVDQRLLLGPIDEVVGKPLVPSSLPVALRQDRDGNCYHAYERIYSDFMEKNPAWKGRLQRTSLDDYRECGRVGGLYVVERQGRIVGVLAARPGAIRGVPGWEVIEQILAEELRGQGLAPIVQRMFLERIDSNDRKLVLGTIDGANHASLRTALRVGRTDGGGWYFIRDSRRPTTRCSG
jgi:hypothetical protein